MGIFSKLKAKAKELELENLNLKADMTAVVTRKGETTYVYSTEMPNLTLQKGNKITEIKVSIASAQDEDEALLHKLLNKVRN